MKTQIKRDAEFIETEKILIEVGSVDFRISVNKFGELVINKYQKGEQETGIIIMPSVSNEIRIK